MSSSKSINTISPGSTFEGTLTLSAPKGHWENVSTKMDLSGKLSFAPMAVGDLNVSKVNDTSSTFEGAWPWTKDLACAVSDPIEPLDAYDDRPSIKGLLQKHEHKIMAVKKELEGHQLYEPIKHDDLWILRFLLSHKEKVKAAARAAEYTLEIRNKYQLDKKDLRKMKPTGKDSFIEATRLFSKHIQPGAMAYSMPDAHRGVVLFFEMAGIDTHKLAQDFKDHSLWLDFHMYLTEWNFQWNDYVSRKTGRLTKSINIVNLKGMGMWNKEYHQHMVEVNEVFELCYPQNRAGFTFINTPGWGLTLWRTLRFFLPKKVVEKVDFINPTDGMKDKGKLLKFMSEDMLPTRFGGSYHAWPLEYPIPDEVGQQKDLQFPNNTRRRSSIKILKKDYVQEVCGMRVEMAPHHRRPSWKRKAEGRKRKGFLRRRRNGKGKGNRIAVDKRTELSASTTYFSALPLAN